MLHYCLYFRRYNSCHVCAMFELKTTTTTTTTTKRSFWTPRVSQQSSDEGLVIGIWNSE